MDDALATLRDVEGGEVTLAANTTAGVYLLPPIVARFRTHYPGVNLHISILNSHEIVEDTLNWQLDFGLVEGDPTSLPTELTVEAFAYDHLVLVVAPNHPWSKLSSITPAMLNGEALVLREQGSGIREVIEQALLAYDVHIHPLFILTDNEAIKQMVINGVGATIVSALTVRRELDMGDLIYLPVLGLDMRPQLSLIQRADRQLSRAAQEFCSFLRPLLEHEPRPFSRT